MARHGKSYGNIAACSIETRRAVPIRPIRFRSAVPRLRGTSYGLLLFRYFTLGCNDGEATLEEKRQPQTGNSLFRFLGLKIPVSTV